MADVGDWLARELRDEHREVVGGLAHIPGVVLPIDLFSVNRLHPALNLGGDAIGVIDRADELLAAGEAAFVACAQPTDAEVAQGALVREVDEVGAVTQATLDQIFVDVRDVLEGRTLACGTGVAGANHQAHPLAQFHPTHMLQVGVARRDGVVEGADRARVPRRWAEARCSGEVQLGAGGNQQVVVMWGLRTMMTDALITLDEPRPRNIQMQVPWGMAGLDHSPGSFSHPANDFDIASLTPHGPYSSLHFDVSCGEGKACLLHTRTPMDIHAVQQHHMSKETPECPAPFLSALR